ncbi:MAG TPA: ferric reductase-like transmembrane domain-containing protein [Nitrospira sp.]|nr:ferric reductase-like transmembrane domain-containing protein [Nitrospira sp.]
MKHVVYGVFWIGIYLLITTAPIFVLLIGPGHPGRGFWREVSVALGFAGLAMIGIQFFLTGRFRAMTLPYGIDVVYHFHRAISLIAFVFIFLHPVILILSYPGTVMLLNPATAPWAMSAGLYSMLAFLVVIGTSIYRLALKLSYEVWRVIHTVAAVAAVALACVHLLGVNYYVEGPAKRGLWMAMAVGWILPLGYVRLVKPLMMRRRPYVVDSVTRERGDAWSLTLRPEGHDGMQFAPGQFAWITIGKSPFAVREHPISFSSSAMRKDQVTFTIKELGDFTSTIGGVVPGSCAYLDGPHGSFTVDRHAAVGFVLLAGGVGITPMMSMVRTLSDRKDRRPLWLFYGTTTVDEATFREELEVLEKGMNLRVIYVVSRPPNGWEGERGYISAEIMARYLPENRLGFEYFICGSQVMQQSAKVALEMLGIPLDQVQSESFNFV